jgi:hypothetical protein
MTGEPWVDYRHCKIFLFFKLPMLAVGSTWLPIERVPGPFLGRKIISGVMLVTYIVRNAWTLTFTPSYVYHCVAFRHRGVHTLDRRMRHK